MNPYSSQNDPNEVKRLIAVMAFAMAILFGWQYFIVPPAENPSEDVSGQTEGLAIDSSLTPDANGSAGNNLVDLIVPDRAEVLARSKRIPIKTDAYTGSINLTGGRLDDLTLSDHFVSIDDGAPNVNLFSPIGSAAPYYYQHLFRAQKSSGITLPDANTEWTLESGSTLSANQPVTLVYDNGDGVLFRLTYEVDDRYLFTLTSGIENKSDKDITVFPTAKVQLDHLNVDGGFAASNLGYVIHEGMIGHFGEDSGLVEVSFADLADDNVKLNKVKDAWMGITTVYWAAVMIPDDEVSTRLEDIGTPDKPIYLAEYLKREPLKANVGQSAATKMHLFAGAKKVDLIDEYSKELNRPSIELIIDWGYLYYLTRPMFYLIALMFSFVGNFGVAILLVTVLIKLMFFPIANKSYVSMTMMKKLQPKVKQIQETNGDDKMKTQKEIMALYKKEKVNPLAGCLPVLLQIPVFFALYKVIYVNIEMRHQPFFGWVHDLSAPDPTSLFNLFGLLPFETAGIFQVGIWPIIMGITMFLQMKMNPAPPDPIQAKIFMIMPFFFTFLLAQFPAGLVIYWAWNNTLSILQQAFIMKRLDVKIELWDNLKSLLPSRKQA